MKSAASIWDVLHDLIPFLQFKPAVTDLSYFARYEIFRKDYVFEEISLQNILAWYDK